MPWRVVSCRVLRRAWTFERNVDATTGRREGSERADVCLCRIRLATTSKALNAVTLLALRVSRLKICLASASVQCGTDAPNFEQRLAFLDAVSSAPDVVVASEWLRCAFCDCRRDAADAQRLQRAITDALDFHDAINRGAHADEVQPAPDRLPPGDALASLMFERR